MPLASGVTNNTCQYWVQEPSVCTNWSIDNIVCSDKSAQFYPFCNLLGTEVKCDKYNSTTDNLTWMCVRPDPNRTVYSRRDIKWVNLPVLDNSGNISKPGNYDPITSYNKGKCDGSGTSIKCSGYMPFHMGFSELQPDDELSSLGYDLGDEITTTSGLVYRLPLSFEIYNMRAKLGRCYWWRGDSSEFSVSISGTVDSPTFRCTNEDEITNVFSKFMYNADLNMYVPPCNGAKPECPFYTNICWNYCLDEFMKHGDFVLAEQILELRYYIRKDKWSKDEYEELFYEPVLYAWSGFLKNIDSGNFIETLVPAIKTEMSSFDYFSLNREDVLLGVGTKADDYLPSYPTLVRELKELTLKPIICNKFEVVENTNIFETYDITHENILIFGDIFNYSSDVYVFNLNDPNLFIPSDIKAALLNNNSIRDLKILLGEDFNEFYTKFYSFLDYIIYNYPDSVIKSEIGVHNNMFIVETPTFFGDNTVVVVELKDGEIEFDKVSFNKQFVGGVIGQLSFNVEGKGVINYLPSYEDSFMTDVNNNGSITFKFFPFTPYTNPVYTYMDGVKQRLSSNYLNQSTDIFKMNYKLYKRKLFSNLVLSIQTNVRFFGNAGYALISIPDENNELIDVFKDWEIEGIRLYYSTNDFIDMEVVYKDSSKLELNQLIIKPKDIKKFSAPCPEEAFITIDSIYIYERHTASEAMPINYIEVKEDFISNDALVEYSAVKIMESNGTYTVTKFSDTTLAPSIVFSGRTGKIRGQAKTKLLTWVRQPFCRDVEIYYSWEAKYKRYKLLPEYKKYGPTGVETFSQLGTRDYTPPCGDHDLSFFSLTGPMWYPYDGCDEEAYYNIRSAILGTDTGVMEVFLPNYGAEVPHGKHDMRMLGPADNLGEICGIHATIWNCSEDWSYCNWEKVGDQYYVGYARYRGGLSYLDKLRATQLGGRLPKFGNTYRDFLRSFRSTDNVDYYYWEGQSYIRRNKWMPLPELYSVVDYSSSFSDYPYKMYISNDFYSDKSLFLDQMGMLLADRDIEAISIGESVLYDRFDFNEVFRVHDTTGIYYPEPKKQYLKGVNLLPVIAWYTYKDNPKGDTSKSIQWAWQEQWRASHPIYYNTNIINNLPSSLYSNGVGIHRFLDIEYPPYKYGARLDEHRLVCDEGNHNVRIIPPSVSGSSPTPVWKVQLNSGPERCFDLDGNWSTASGCNDDLYSTCTQAPWVTEVTVFDTGYTSKTPDVNRTIITYDDVGNEVKTYYHRGLNIAINKDRLNDYLPFKYTLLKAEDYELKFSQRPIRDLDGFWSSLPDLNQYYPAYVDMEAIFNAEQNSVDISIKPNGTSVFAIGVEYLYGAISTKENDVERVFLYSVPGIKVTKTSVDLEESELLSIDNLILANKSDNFNSLKTFYKLPHSIKDLFTGVDNFKISFRLKATDEELLDFGYNTDYYELENVFNLVGIKRLYVYTAELIEAVEPILTYERKYNVSLGTHGDFPPHGYNSTGSLLYHLPGDSSTVYQMDSIYGVVGMPGTAGSCKTMNKVRGRIIYECHHDKEPIVGSADPYYYEDEQKKIHDKIAFDGNVSFTMSSVAPASLSALLVRLGLSFPKWNCEFTNTIVRPLAPIHKFTKFSPCGHHFRYDFEHLEQAPCVLCGHALPVPCEWEDIYDRIYERACQFSGSGYSIVPNNAVVAYFRGIANVLIRPFEYFLRPQIERSEFVAEGLNSWYGTIEFDFPDGPISLY